ncbi:hypothetical protein PSH03_003769 [Micromonospora sp. PSH03]|uniref:hypothetical protein n=1 Tax=Micromonospora salmantinae TaxID=2911211 RepID=UPI001EE9075B|nr:hypothetical protein [Micromonospora salmantinae]MCG5454609.1 hypothetical protein [Micromonospora salmantinae]
MLVIIVKGSGAGMPIRRLAEIGVVEEVVERLVVRDGHEVVVVRVDRPSCQRGQDDRSRRRMRRSW